MRLTNFPTSRHGGIPPLAGKARSCKMWGKPKLILSLFLLILLFGLVFIDSSIAQDSTDKSQTRLLTEEAKDGIRILISTSGPAKFSSKWLDNPPRLLIEFRTRNIISKLDNEVMVNQGVIKRITSEYFGSGEEKSLKSLTFELTQKVPYKIWQEDNNIILDIHASLTTPLGSEGKEVFVKDESKEQIGRRLETMEARLKQVPVVQVQEPPKLIAKTTPPQRKTTAPIAFWLMALPIGKQTIALWLIGLTLISSLGLLAWLFWRRYKLILDKNLAACEIAKLKTQVQERNQLLEHEQIIRKTVESTSLQREKEFDHLKTELQEEKQVLEQEQEARKIAEEGLSQKEKEVVEVKGSLESLKEVLVEKGLAKKLTTAEKEGELWISGKSTERRELPRLDLSKDYNRTIILRIESADKSKSIKSFANNIGLEGLCFETRHEFNEKEKLSVRLFFFGDKVPMMRMQAKVTWSKIDTPVNHYGISFMGLEEKDKAELNSYIESNLQNVRV